MRPARAYAAVAARRAWADLLWRLHLRRRSGDAYDAALARAYACYAADFEPVAVTSRPAAYSCEHMTLSGTVREPRCWRGCRMAAAPLTSVACA
jgi:hypothetical protein